MKKIFIITIVGLVVSCGNYKSGVFQNWVSSGTAHSTKARYSYFNGKIVRTREFKSNTEISFSYSAAVEKGSLAIHLKYPNDTVKTIALIEAGVSNERKSVPIDEGGKYQVIVEGKETTGSYDVAWTIK